MLRQLAVGTAVALGTAAALFFTVFAGVFTDAPGGLLHPERLLSYLLTAAAHFLLAGIGSHFGRKDWRAWAVLVAAPAIVFLAWYSTRETQVLALHAAYAVLVAASAALGAYFARTKWCPVPYRE